VKVNDFYLDWYVVGDWSVVGDINSGVPQGSILGPILFLLYINDLSEVIEHCILYLYADDSSLFIPVKRDEDVQIAHDLLLRDLGNMSRWAYKWKMFFKACNSNELIFRSSRDVTRE
jgi:hypothetical protein